MMVVMAHLLLVYMDPYLCLNFVVWAHSVDSLLLLVLTGRL